MVDPLAPLLREAYATGWTLSGGPMTDRVRAGSIAAVRLGLAYPDAPGLLEATLRLGHLEGVWARIFERRLALHDGNDADVMAVWRKLAAGFDAGPLAAAAAAGEIPAVEADGALAAHLRDLAGQARRLLQALSANPLWQKLRTAVRTALARGLAEGKADALALAADKLGRVGFGFDLAFDDAYRALEDADGLLTEADAWIARALGDQGKAIGAKLAQAARDGASAKDMTAAVKDLMAQGSPVRKVVDQLTSRAMSQGAVNLYRSEGVKLIDFITAGDQRVCDQCALAEADGPYPPNDVPIPGLHPGCRCALAAEDTLGLTAVQDYTGPTMAASNAAGSEAGGLARHIASGIAAAEALGGGSMAATDLVTFEDGTQAVRKTAHMLDEAAAQADAEDLASRYGQALGMPIPAVLKDGTTVWMDYVADAKTGAGKLGLGWGGGATPEAIELADSEAGRKLGLFDLVTGNVDRNNENWLLDADGRLVGIDHGLAFQQARQSRFDQPGVDLTHKLLETVAGPNNLFAHRLLAVDVGTPDIGGTRDFTTGDLDHMRQILESLRQQFADAGRLGWYEAALARIGWLRDYAQGEADLWP